MHSISNITQFGIPAKKIYFSHDRLKVKKNDEETYLAFLYQ